MVQPLRFFSFGDIHYNTVALNRVITFINKAVALNKCDFVVQTGDLCSSSYNADLSELTDLKNNYFSKINVPYFLIPGNHDVIGSTCHSGCSTHTGSSVSCNFRTVYGSPDIIKTFVKDGFTYQIIGCSICPDSSASYYWIFDFAQSGLSKTLPTIVLNHGPIVLPSDTSCGSWSGNTYKYSITQNLKGQMDLLNVLASYTGHVHAPRKTILNNRLYVSENTISDSNERCTADSTRFIGYTKIVSNSLTAHTVMYGLLRYQNADGTVPAFIDPFPDTLPLPTPTPTPTPTAVPITASSLMARIQPHLVIGNKVNPTSPMLQSQNMDGSVYIYRLPVTPPVYVYTSSASIDCDGQYCPNCDNDPTNQGETSFTQSNGQYLQPCILPWYVLPETPNPIFDYTTRDIRGGQLGIVINGSKISYGVFGDERGRDVGNADGRAIGEISYAMASALGINPDPANGGADSGVTYIVFTSTENVVSPIESVAAAKTMGDREILKLYNALASSLPPVCGYNITQAV